jgi:hypothetical protein
MPSGSAGSTAGAEAPIQPTRISIGAPISAALDFYKADFGSLFLSYLLFIPLGMLGGALFYVSFIILTLVLAGIASAVGEEAGFVLLITLGPLLAIVIYAALLYFMLGLFAGHMKFVVDVCRGKKPEIGAMFSKFGTAPRLIGVMLLLAVITTPVAFLAMLPAALVGDETIGPPLLFVGWLCAMGWNLFIQLTFGLAPFLIVDQNLGVIDSLKTSASITSGNRLALFVIGLYCSFLAFVGTLLCGFGILFTIPLAITTVATAYLMMSGQNTPGPPRVVPGQYGSGRP